MRGGRHEGDFAHSLADLMSGVAVTFLLIASIFIVQSARDREAAKRAQARAEELAKRNENAAHQLQLISEQGQDAITELKNLRARLEGNTALRGAIELDYDPKKDPRLLTIVFTRDSLQFASGECVVGASQRPALKQSLRQIFPQVCATVGTGLVQSITLEGHTDTAPPFGGRCGMVSSHDDASCFAGATSDVCRRNALENNVRLSGARAQFVFFEAREALLGDSAVAECLDKKFIVAGRGPMDPIDGRPLDAPRTADEMARNRRVVIRVRVMAGSVKN